MAAGQNQRKRKKDPMLTKTSKNRLEPLNITQLNKLLEASTKPKDKNKILRAISKHTIVAA